MDEIQYKGYTIQAMPNQLADTKHWSVEIVLSKMGGGSAVEKQFSVGNTFPTEEEAKKHCLEFGRQIIDGKHPKLKRP